MFYIYKYVWYNIHTLYIYVRMTYGLYIYTHVSIDLYDIYCISIIYGLASMLSFLGDLIFVHPGDSWDMCWSQLQGPAACYRNFGHPPMFFFELRKMNYWLFGGTWFGSFGSLFFVFPQAQDPPKITSSPHELARTGTTWWGTTAGADPPLWPIPSPGVPFHSPRGWKVGLAQPFLFSMGFWWTLMNQSPQVGLWSSCGDEQRCLWGAWRVHLIRAQHLPRQDKMQLRTGDGLKIRTVWKRLISMMIKGFDGWNLHFPHENGHELGRWHPAFSASHRWWFARTTSDPMCEITACAADPKGLLCLRQAGQHPEA